MAPALPLVALAGATDALMILHSKMLLAVYVTGNSAKAGVMFAHGVASLPGALLTVVGVFFGATTAAAWLGGRLDRWRAPCLLAAVGALLAVASLLVRDAASGAGYPLAAVLWIAAAMGTLNQVLADEPGVTFITGALVRGGRALARGDWAGAVAAAVRWHRLVAGAVAAATLEASQASWTLAAVAGAALLVAAGWWLRLRGAGLGVALPQRR